MNSQKLLPLILLLSVGCIISGCEQAPKPANSSQTVIKKYSKTTTIEGTVGSGHSIIKTGAIEITDENGRKITAVAIENGHFQAEIPSGTVLPLLLNFSSENHPDKLISVVFYEDVTNYFIDPSTTAIAKAAKAMGGYTHANLVRAAEDTTHTPDANKTTTGWRGDPTTQYGGWH